MAGGVESWGNWGETSNYRSDCFNGSWNIRVFCFLLESVLVAKVFYFFFPHFICLSNADSQCSLWVSWGAWVSQSVR